jgi:uncharacterized protein
MTLKRFYRFHEFGRDIVYDREGVTAFFVNKGEAQFLDYLEEGKSCEECALLLVHAGYTPDEITDAVEHLESEGALTDPESCLREPVSRSYILTLNVTQECNLRCTYCFVEKSDSSAFMSKETARKAIDFIMDFDMKGVGIAFYGGEPLLNFPVVKAAMEYASQEAEKRGLPEVTYQLTTNGTLILDEMITFFTKYPISIMVSLDGPASIHDAMRVTATGEKTHAVVVKNLQKLIKTPGRHKVSVSGVVTGKGRLKDSYEYLSQFPLKETKLSHVHYLNECDAVTYKLSDKKKEAYMEDMRALAWECVDLISKGVRPPYYNFENMIIQLWKHAQKSRFCFAGVGQYGISPEGDIYPCGPAANLKEFKLGSLDKGVNQQVLNEWARSTSWEDKECITCWAQALCVGGCPLQLVRNVDKDTCEITQHTTRLAIAIYAAVKDINEMMLASLVDEEFLSDVVQVIDKVKNRTNTSG